MNFSLNTWIGQVTTGHGAMILGPTLLAVATGTMTWPVAVPLLAAGVIGLLWPENTALNGATQTVASDVEALITAYSTGLSHGAAEAAPAATPVASNSEHHTGTATALAVLIAAGLALTACAAQTPAQQSATATAIASGVLCLADATGKVVATASTSDSNTLKAVNAAVAAGDVLLTDSACQTALTNGTAAIPQISTVQH